MIDWMGLAANTLWIVGCALGLAVLSCANWEAGVSGERLLSRLRRPLAQVAVNLACVLFCLGLAAISDAVAETALWLFLMVLCFVQMAYAILARRRD